MMRRILILLLLSSLYLSSLSQDFRSFIPNDYDTLYDGVARGDLNKDGIADIAMVLRPNWERMRIGEKEALIVMLRQDY